MQALYYKDIEKFYEQLQPVLQQKPVLYAQMLSIIHSIVLHPENYSDRPPYALLMVDEHGQVVGGALRVPPRPLMVTEMPQAAADALAEKVETLDLSLPSVIGPASDSWKFARKFSGSDRIPELRLHMRLYCLREVDYARQTEAHLRQCNRSDSEHLYRWIRQFAEECELPLGAPSREHVDNRVERGEYFYWMLDQKPVAMMRRHFDNGSRAARIGSVYTPFNWRGSGFGTDGTAALTRQCLLEGAKDCRC